jgi:PrcB C-terminal
MIAILIAVMSLLQPDAIAVRTIDRGANSNVDEARQAVARTDAEWSALWKAHDANRPMPKVDLSKEMIVAVFLGSRPTAGYAVEIVGAEVKNGALVVRYRETRPAPGTITAQILTSPYHIAAVRKHDGDVRFEKA